MITHRINGGSSLAYGRVLQFGIAVIAFLLRGFFLGEENPEFSGCWGSLALANLDSVLIWVSIFRGSMQGIIHAVGFALYALALIHALKDLAEIARFGGRKYGSA